MKDYRKIAKEFALHLRSKLGDQIKRIILFGSVAVLTVCIFSRSDVTFEKDSSR